MSEADVIERKTILADYVSRHLRDAVLRGISPSALGETYDEMIFPRVYPPWKAVKRNEADRRIEGWLSCVERFRKIEELREFVDLTRWFSISAWAHKAIAAKWSNEDLFAMDDGLIASLRRIGGRSILNIDPEGRITLMKSGEMVYLWPQKTKSYPWWNDNRTIRAMVKHDHETRGVVMEAMNARFIGEVGHEDV